MIIASILKSKGGQVIAVRPDDPASLVCATLAEHRIGAVLVREADGSLHGIVSERDIVRALAGKGEACLTQSAASLMTRDLITVTPQTQVTEALALMTDRRIRHLPVLEYGKLAGMVSIGDLVKARIDEAVHEAETLKAYVVSSG